MTLTPETIAELRALLAKAAPAPWTADSIDSEDGRGKYKAYAVFDAEGKEILDTQNAHYMAVEIYEERDEEGTYAWDERGRLNAELAAAACSNLPALLDAAERVAELEAAAARESNLRARLNAIHGHATEILREISKGGLPPAEPQTPTNVLEEMWRASLGVWFSKAEGRPSWETPYWMMKALTAALAVAGDDWEPIETAPRDGTEVDLYLQNDDGKRSRCVDCHYHLGEWLNWNCNDGDEPRWHNVEKDYEGDVIWKVTHWRPLPPAPKEG